MLVPGAFESVQKGLSPWMGGTQTIQPLKRTAQNTQYWQLSFLPFSEFPCWSPRPRGEALRSSTVNPLVKNKWGFKGEVLI